MSRPIARYLLHDLRAYALFVGPLLIGLGVILILLALGLAFTIYGEISGVLGVACLFAGIVRVIRGRAGRHS